MSKSVYGTLWSMSKSVYGTLWRSEYAGLCMGPCGGMSMRVCVWDLVEV